MSELSVLEKNVRNIWGQKGQAWLNQLPEVIKLLSERWSLIAIKPVKNMSYNYVALANQQNKRPAVLKISCDTQLITNEYKALKHFNGRGAIKVIDIDKQHNALLLEQASPGYLLKDHHPRDIKDTINIYATVIRELANQKQPDTQYIHVNMWCKAIDRIDDERIASHLVKKAKDIKEFLLNSAKKEYLCHGDLHLENIIQHKNKWLSIDPKGIISEMAFEAAAFDLIDKSEWTNPKTIQGKIIKRINLLASTLGIDKDRLLAWIFLRVIISAQWFIEDNGNPDEMRNLASYIFTLVSDDFQTIHNIGEHRDY